jgi:hypothetical protein
MRAVCFALSCFISATTSLIGVQSPSIAGSNPTFMQTMAVQKPLRAILGGDFEHFMDCTQYMDTPIKKGGHVFTSGYVRGLATLMESFVDKDEKTGKCVAGYISGDDQLKIYGAKSVAEIPPAARAYIEDLQKRRESADSVRLVFTVPPPVLRAKVVALKAVNTARLGGTYERIGDNTRFYAGTLELKELPKNSVKFKIEAMNGGHTGGASGTVTIKDRLARYNGPDGKLSFRFPAGKPIIVEEAPDSSFCGVGVTLSGQYRKIKD